MKVHRLYKVHLHRLDSSFGGQLALLEVCDKKPGGQLLVRAPATDEEHRGDPLPQERVGALKAVLLAQS